MLVEKMSVDSMSDCLKSASQMTVGKMSVAKNVFDQKAGSLSVAQHCSVRFQMAVAGEAATISCA
jgi:hypothetical protein